MSCASNANATRPLLSVVMITLNAERLLDLVLFQAKKIADEIVIVDSGSTDKTLEIARKYTQKIIHQEWLGFGLQKQKAVDLATGDWILVLDADEVLDENLLTAIEQTIKTQTIKTQIIKTQKIKATQSFEAFVAYEIKRPLVFAGKIIRRSVPLWTTRLFQKNKGRFTPKVVHESLEIEGRVGRITSGELLHYSYENMGDWLLRMHKYTDLFVEENREKTSKPRSIAFACVSAVTVFLKIFIFKLGFLEGRAGFVVALNWAVGNYIKYTKLALNPEFCIDTRQFKAYAESH
jgi:glycosyltransferase involved in cell wall biosynthesis